MLFADMLSVTFAINDSVWLLHWRKYGTYLQYKWKQYRSGNLISKFLTLWDHTTQNKVSAFFLILYLLITIFKHHFILYRSIDKRFPSLSILPKSLLFNFLPPFLLPSWFLLYSDRILSKLCKHKNTKLSS